MIFKEENDHAAVMLENSLTRILGTDRHFDRLAEIERIDRHDFRSGMPRCLNGHPVFGVL